MDDFENSEKQGDSPEPVSAEISLVRADASTVDHAQISLTPGQENDSRAAGARYATGTLLVGRFRVKRFIARGGMGEVYEVKDELTGRNMALKAVLPRFAQDPQFFEQMKQEINNARDVTHPNVCRVFEVFEDKSVDPPSYLLTMELLEGETISEILRRRGPLSVVELLPIAQQMAAGLEAVHAAAIVHQDFKTSNVLMVEADGKSRVVVTDFGLAVNLRAKDGGVGGGTPAYMAPEQVQGLDSIDKRADIYAFGVVLYELLTGHFPISAQSVPELKQRKLVEPPVPPSHYCPGIPPHWEKAILRCLERDPERRFSNLDELMAALERRAERRRHRRIAIATAALVIAAVAGIGGSIARRWMVTHRVPTVAVVGLTNKGEAATNFIATELAELLTANLAGSKDLYIVGQEDVATVKGEFPATQGSNLEREDLSGIRNAIGADYLIVGHYQSADAPDEPLSFDLTVRGPKGDSLGDPIHEQGTEKDFRNLLADAAAQIRRKVGSTLLPEVEGEEAANIYPADQKARRLYFDSLSKLRSLNSVAALQGLKEAERIENSNAAIHAAAAEALVLQKSFGEARLEAKRAQELARNGQLPREYVMLLEARSAELSNDWNAAIQRLDALYQLSRDKLRYGILLSRAQIGAMRPADALHTLEVLAKLPEPAGSDPRILISQAEARSLEGNYNAEIESAERAIRLANKRGWQLMAARANLQLCWAQQRIRSGGDALAACNEAHRIFNTAGDPVNTAVVINNLANWQVSRGNFEQARQAYEQVLEITTKAQDAVDSAGAHLNLAGTLLRLNDLSACRKHVDEAIRLASTAGDKYDEARARLILADLYRSDGNSHQAIAETEHALSLASEVGDRDLEGYAWTNLIMFQRNVGDPEGALAAGEKAVALRQEMDDRSGVAAAEEFIADVYRDKGELSRARQLYTEAIKLRDSGQKASIAQLWLSLAGVEYDSGEYASAKSYAEMAANEYQVEKDGDSQADALALMVRIAVATHDLARADSLLKQITSLQPQDQEVIAHVAQARAEWLVASGNPQAAVILLAQTIGQRNGVSYAELDSRLSLARAQWAARDMDRASVELARVRRESQKKGFRLLAQKAASAHAQH